MKTRSNVRHERREAAAAQRIRMQSSMPPAWHWPTRKIVEQLNLRNAMRAKRGRSSPVAARVAERLSNRPSMVR